MSRAFVKETDTPADAIGDLPLSPHPNYITPAGLQRLQRRQAEVRERLELIAEQPLHAAEQADLQRQARWLRSRIGSAIETVLPAGELPERVCFGCWVDLVEVDSASVHRFRIVGEDEADPAQGLLSWISPLARALEGAARGDIRLWPRPAGDREVQVLGIQACD